MAKNIVTSIEPHSNETVIVFIPTSYYYGKNLKTDSLEVELIGNFDNELELRSGFSIMGKIENDGLMSNQEGGLEEVAIYSQVISAEEKLNQAIGEAILEHNLQNRTGGGNAFESHTRNNPLEAIASRGLFDYFVILLIYLRTCCSSISNGILPLFNII